MLRDPDPVFPVNADLGPDLFPAFLVKLLLFLFGRERPFLHSVYFYTSLYKSTFKAFSPYLMILLLIKPTYSCFKIY